MPLPTPTYAERIPEQSLTSGRPDACVRAVRTEIRSGGVYISERKQSAPIGLCPPGMSRCRRGVFLGLVEVGLLVRHLRVEEHRQDQGAEQPGRDRGLENARVV